MAYWYDGAALAATNSPVIALFWCLIKFTTTTTIYKFRICHGTRGVTVTHLRRIRRVLGSTPGECQFFSIISLLPFFCAALAKRWKVQFRQG